MVSITKVVLNNFRNYDNSSLIVNNKNILLVGDNGSGKSNLLEAISLLAVGRGMKQSTYSDMIKYSTSSFYVDYTIKNEHNIIDKVSISYNTKKHVEINGKKNSTSIDINNIINIIWSAPHVIYLVAHDKSSRRKFFDRMINNHFPEHLMNILKYDNLRKQRINIITNGYYDEVWLINLENMIAEFAIKIAKQRQIFCELLMDNIVKVDNNKDNISLNIEGEFETILYHNYEKYDLLKSFYIKKLKTNRSVDSKINRTCFGIHKSDFVVTYGNNNIILTMCSTGQQKNSIIKIIMASIIKNKTVFLIDDLSSSLDKNTLSLLLNCLHDKKCQIISSDVSIFDECLYNNVYDIISIHDNDIHHCEHT